MSPVARIKDLPYPEDLQGVPEIKEYLKRLYTALQEEQSERIEDFDWLKIDNKPFVDVREYGAKGDGVTDDTTAIQSAIDYAETIFVANIIHTNYSYVAPEIYIPEGVYLVTSLTLSKQLTIRGTGILSTFIKSATDATIFAADMTTTANYMPPIFKDLAITGDPTLTSQHGITSTLHCRLENVMIENVGGDGFKSTNGNSNEILYSKIQRCGGYGVHLTGTYNTNCHIIGNIIRENKIGLYIKPSSGTITTGFVLNNVFESNLSVEGTRFTNTQVGTATRPGVGIWLEDVQELIIADNYFENQLNDIYGDTVSFCHFRNNYHGGSNGVPGDYTGHGGPARKRQDITIVSGQGNQFTGERYRRPVKPGATSAADWGTTYSGTTGTITDAADGFGAIANVASVTLTAGDVAAMGISVGDWIRITDITGNIGTDVLNDHDFQVLMIHGELLVLSPANCTGKTYTSGGTAEVATTWPYEYEHILPGTRATIIDCVWQAPSGVNEPIILAYNMLHHTTNISTAKSGANTRTVLDSGQEFVLGGYRSNIGLYYGTYHKWFAPINLNQYFKFYTRAGKETIFSHTRVSIEGEEVASEQEALRLSQDGLTFTDETMTTTGNVSNKCPGTELDSNGGAITATLGSGHYIGQIKTIVMVEASNLSTVSVTLHETTDPEIGTFDAVDEYWTLVWTGTEWATIKATCTFL